MPANRIQPRTWFVELQLTPRDSPSDADVGSCIKNILDLSNNFRLIRGLQHVSFAYSVRDPMQDTDLAGTQVHSNMVEVVHHMDVVHQRERRGEAGCPWQELKISDSVT